MKKYQYVYQSSKFVVEMYFIVLICSCLYYDLTGECILLLL